MTMTTGAHRRTAAVMAATMVLLTACGGDAASDGDGGEVTPEVTAPPDAPAAEELAVPADTASSAGESSAPVETEPPAAAATERSVTATIGVFAPGPAQEFLDIAMSESQLVVFDETGWVSYNPSTGEQLLAGTGEAVSPVGPLLAAIADEGVTFQDGITGTVLSSIPAAAYANQSVTLPADGTADAVVADFNFIVDPETGAVLHSFDFETTGSIVANSATTAVVLTADETTLTAVDTLTLEPRWSIAVADASTVENGGYSSVLSDGVELDIDTGEELGFQPDDSTRFCEAPEEASASSRGARGDTFIVSVADCSNDGNFSLFVVNLDGSLLDRIDLGDVNVEHVAAAGRHFAVALSREPLVQIYAVS